jgi:zinc transport system substrate-binding protein
MKTTTGLIRYLSILFIILIILLGTGVPATAKLSVFVSIVPQKYFVQQIGGNLVAVQAMVAPGASPATYEPKPRQMAALSDAKLYLAIGVPFEKSWLAKLAAANPRMKVIHTDRAIAKRPMIAHDHGHGHEADAAAAGSDPHIWLSPPLVKIQARTILAALQEVDPGHGNVYTANYKDFEGRIDRLDADLKNILAGKAGLRFMVFHPSWGYFADTYGLIQVPIEIEGKAPKPAQLAALIRQARESGVRVVFVQPQFSTKSAQIVAREIGGQVVFADPLAEDWMVNLRSVAAKFQAALK